MRKAYLLFVFFISFLYSFSQNATLKIDNYSIPDNINDDDHRIILHMPYAKSSIVKIEGDTALLRKAAAMIIDVVCSDYPTYLSLNDLNNRRLQEALRLFPFIKEEQVKKVNIYRQLKGSIKNTAQTMFHGVVIRFRPRQDKETMERDLSKLNELLTPFSDNKFSTYDTSNNLSKIDVSSLPTEKAIIEERKLNTTEAGTMELPHTIEEIMEVSGIISWRLKRFSKRPKDFKDADSMTVISPVVAYKKELIDKQIFNRYYKYDEITIFFKKYRDTLFLESDIFYDSDSSGIGTISRQMPDSTIIKVLERNKWQNTAVISDVTGSMYPYSAQLLVWLKLNSLEKLTKKFIFFNDGDDTPDEYKKIGETKGIYGGNYNSFEEVRDLLKATMQKGSGGDAPENNIEALLQAELLYPETDYLILIADNWANIKDKVLINKLRKPVRVVLCGVYNYEINVEYLNLARRTGGSIHLMEMDIQNLASLHEGEEIKIGLRTFVVSNGEFVEVRRG